MTGESTMKAVRSIATLVALVVLITAVACGKKTPPVARPAPPPPTPADTPAPPAAGTARAGARAGERAARSGSRRRDCVGIARRSQQEFAVEAGVLRTRQQRLERREPEGAGRERGAAEAIYQLDRDDRRTLRRARDGRVQSGIGRAARGRRRARISCRWGSPPTDCERSATAKSSRSILVMTKPRLRKTAAPISSSPRSEPMKQTVSCVLLAALLLVAPRRRRARRTKNISS